MHVLGTVFNSSLFPGRAPDGMVALTSFAGGATDPQFCELPGAEITATICAEVGDRSRNFRRAGGDELHRLSRGRYRNTIWATAKWCSPRKLTAAAPELFLTGNYLSGPSIGACVDQATRTAQDVRVYLASIGVAGVGAVAHARDRLQPSLHSSRQNLTGLKLSSSLPVVRFARSAPAFSDLIQWCRFSVFSGERNRIALLLLAVVQPWPEGKQPTDAALMERILQQDSTALETLYDRYGRPVYSLVLRIAQQSRFGRRNRAGRFSATLAQRRPLSDFARTAGTVAVHHGPQPRPRFSAPEARKAAPPRRFGFRSIVPSAVVRPRSRRETSTSRGAPKKFALC